MSNEQNLTALSLTKGLCQDAFANMVGGQKERALEHLRAAIELQDLLFAKLASADGAPESRAVEQWLDEIVARLDALPSLQRRAMERGFAAARKAGVRLEDVLTPIEMPHDMREAFEAATAS